MSLLLCMFIAAAGTALANGRFVANLNGTVTDTKTGLMWQQADDGVVRNWDEAEAYCETLELPSPGGYTDWRAPRIDELQTIINYATYIPAGFDPPFVTRSSNYWSISTNANEILFKAKGSLLKCIPPHKTLFFTSPGKGLPIGNLSSQFFANLYLYELDQFVKRELGCRYYLRYCDDFLLLSTSPEELASWREGIEAFLVEKLLLKLNGQQHRLRPVANGIDFLGYVVRRRYVLVRRRVVNHLRERLHGFDEELVERRSGQLTAWCYSPAVMAAMSAVVASYLGHLQWADSTRLVLSLFRSFRVWRAAFLWRDGRLIPRYLLPKRSTNLRQEYRC